MYLHCLIYSLHLENSCYITNKLYVRQNDLRWVVKWVFASLSLMHLKVRGCCTLIIAVSLIRTFLHSMPYVPNLGRCHVASFLVCKYTYNLDAMSQDAALFTINLQCRLRHDFNYFITRCYKATFELNITSRKYPRQGIV